MKTAIFEVTENKMDNLMNFARDLVQMKTTPTIEEMICMAYSYQLVSKVDEFLNDPAGDEIQQIYLSTFIDSRLNDVSKFIKYKGEEIPKDIPVSEYHSYIWRNLKVDALNKNESEWTARDYKEYNSRERRMSLARHMGDIVKKNEPLSNRQRRIIERIRTGVDFDVPEREYSILTENPDTFEFYDEWKNEYLKTHPEDRDKSYADLNPIRLSEMQLYHYEFMKGKYYGAEIPSDIPYAEYERYLGRNVKYWYHSKRSNQYTDMDKMELELYSNRLLAANIIRDWKPEELTEWQKEVIEKIRVGIELKDDIIAQLVKLAESTIDYALDRYLEQLALERGSEDLFAEQEEQ